MIKSQRYEYLKRGYRLRYAPNSGLFFPTWVAKPLLKEQMIEVVGNVNVKTRTILTTYRFTKKAVKFMLDYEKEHPRTDPKMWIVSPKPGKDTDDRFRLRMNCPIPGIDF